MSRTSVRKRSEQPRESEGNPDADITEHPLEIKVRHIPVEIIEGNAAQIIPFGDAGYRGVRS